MELSVELIARAQQLGDRGTDVPQRHGRKHEGKDHIHELSGSGREPQRHDIRKPAKRGGGSKESAALLRGGGIAEAEIRTDIYRHGSDPALFVDSFGNFVIPYVFFLCHASFSPSASSGAAVCASANC